MPGRSLPLAIFLVLLCATAASAQDYRVKMQVPPVTLYGTMLERSERNEFDKVYKSLPFLKPLFEEEKQRFGVDVESIIRDALKTNDRTEVIRAIHLAIYVDIKDIFHAVRNGKEKDHATLKTWFTMASMDYKLIMPDIRREDFDTSEEIHKAFNQGLSMMRIYDSPFAPGKKSAIDFDSLDALMKRIDTRLVKVRPDFAKRGPDVSLEQHIPASGAKGGE